MIRYLLTIGYASACLFAATNTVTLAQTSSSGKDQQQTAVLENIQTSVLQAIGAQAGTVEVTISRNILTVARVNSNMNNSTHAGRDNEATAIALIVSKAIAGKREFQNIIVIRVEYLVRSESAIESKVVDTVEFRRDPNGKFQFHST